MIDWGFWGVAIMGVFGAIGGVVAFISHTLSIKKNLSKQDEPELLAKPVLSNIEACSIDVGNAWLWGRFHPRGPFFREEVRFKFLIDNKGEKACSVTSVKIKLPNGSFAKLDDKISKPTLPQIIEVEHPVKFVMYGFCSEPQKLPDVVKECTSGISAEQKSVEATIIIKFNNTEDITEKTVFDVKHSTLHI